MILIIPTEGILMLVAPATLDCFQMFNNRTYLKYTEIQHEPELLYVPSPSGNCQALYHGEESLLNACIQLCLSKTTCTRSSH